MCSKILTIIIIFFITATHYPQSQTIVCKGTNINAFTSIGPPTIYKDRLILGKIATTNILVYYDEGIYYVPITAREAFNYAVDIWKHLLTAPKTIKIKVEFHDFQNSEDLGSTQIAQYNNNWNLPFNDIQYPTNLAKQLNTGIPWDNYDFIIKFNKNSPWNYETDGIPVEDFYDFASVALHEIEHGFGMAGSMNVQGANGSFGFSGYLTNTTGVYPTIYDKFGKSGTERLIEVTNPTTLAGLLTGNNVVFDGSNAKKANHNANVKLYAPAEWESGSSFSHLNEETFPAGNQNSLMSPSIDKAEVIHSPGEIGLGILNDLGWQVNRMISFSNPSSITHIVRGQFYTVKWYDNISQFGDFIDIKLYKITANDPVYLEDINQDQIFSNPGWENNNFNWIVNEQLENGYYFLKAVGYNHTVDLGKSSVFIISDEPEAPHFNPPPRQYASAQNVTLDTNSPVTKIRYTLNGSDPDENSPEYTLPIPVGTTTTIKARSYLTLNGGGSVHSQISEALFFIGEHSFVAERTCNYGNFGIIGKKMIYPYNYLDAPNQLRTGITSSQHVYRSWIRWTGFRQIIPAFARIQSVEVIIPWNPFYSEASIEFKNYTPSSYPDFNWDSIGTGALYATMPANSQVFNIDDLAAKIQSIVNGIGSDELRLGIKNTNENNQEDLIFHNYPVTIRIYYRGNVEVTQLDKDDAPFGKVGWWNASYWSDPDVPFTLFRTQGTPLTLRSSQNYKDGTSQKYQKWLRQPDVVNHNTFTIESGINYFDAKFDEADLTPIVKNSYELSPVDPLGDKIWIRDPWLIDENDPPYGNRNQGMNGGNTGIPGADWYEKNSPIDYSLPDFANYKGVFLDQLVSSGTYYSVKANLTQDITLTNTGNPSGRNHHFIFQNWGGSNVAFEDANARGTGVVFTDINAVANANYKGTQLSNNQIAFANNGQKKFVRTYDQQYNTTRFHLVYESMNKVWYERSTDGINWEIMNNGQPIYEGIGKHPSIDALPGSHSVIIVYNKDEWVIAAQYYEDGIFKFESIVCDNGWVMGNAKPVIVCAYVRFLVAWDDHFGDINYRFGQLCTNTNPPGYYFNWYFDPRIVTYSEGTVKNNLTIATSTNKSYWLAWDSNQSSIQLVNLTAIDTLLVNDLQESQAFTFDQTGFSKNYKPSIIVWKNGNETNDRVRVSWIAFRKTYQSDNPPAGGEQFLGESKVFFRSYDNGVWSAYNSFGVNVTSANINKNSDNSFAFAWSEGDGIVNKFIRSDNLTNIRTQNTSGKYLQVGNYANLNSMRLMSFKASTLPYYFLLSNAFNWIPPQQTEPPITDREGVITKDTTSLYFSVGEITVDGEKINFVALPDTSVVNGSEALNTYLISEPFNLTENTFFTYGVQYGVTDSLSAAMTLTEGKSVNFRVELMDEQTNEVLGTFDDVTFSEGSIIPYKSIAYQVNTEGIGNRICRLRLVIDDNLYPEYSLTNDYNGEAVLSKQGFVERTLSVNEIVKTYDLEQNYPNPFNPVTTIRYQLPKEGLVTLKVYDILGSEVATLVNEQKTTGKYEANFNASRLASGVYIYRLQANDYISVKKMVLLK